MLLLNTITDEVFNTKYRPDFLEHFDCSISLQNYCYLFIFNEHSRYSYYEYFENNFMSSDHLLLYSLAEKTSDTRLFKQNSLKKLVAKSHLSLIL